MRAIGDCPLFDARGQQHEFAVFHLSDAGRKRRMRAGDRPAGEELIDGHGRLLSVGDAADGNCPLAAERVARGENARQVGFISAVLGRNRTAGDPQAPRRHLLGGGPADGKHHGVVLRSQFFQGNVAADPRVPLHLHAKPEDLLDLAPQHVAGQLRFRDLAA